MKPFTTFKIKYGKGCSLLSLTVIFLLLNFVVSCHSSDRNNDSDRSEIYNHQFGEIRKLVYENPSLARERSNKILKALSPYSKKAEILCLKYIGSSYAFESNYSEAIKYYKQSLKKAEKINLYVEIANLNNNLGTIYNEYGDYRSAYIYFIKALENYDLAGNKDKKTGTLNNIGLTYLNLDHKEKALNYFNSALHSSNAYKDTILTATILNNIAICHFAKRNWCSDRRV